MTDNPFLDIKSDFVGVYSGKAEDCVPVIAFSHCEGEFLLQLPGGGSIALPLDIASRLAIRISKLADNAIEFDWKF